MRILHPRSGYSGAERVSDGVVHVVGLAAALTAVPLLVIRTSALNDQTMTVATSIYGATLVAMILCSALYNMVRPGVWTGLLRRLDHSAIYFKIAGTYTPFTVLSGGHGGYLLAGLWTAALAGTGLRVWAHQRVRWLAVGLYLAMGWVGAIAGWSLFAQMPGHVLALIVAGGLLYTVGFAFYLAKRLPFHNTIWHLFVLVASACFFAAVSAFVADLHGARAEAPLGAAAV